MEKKKEIPFIFYLYLHSKVCEVTKGDLISKKYLTYYISKYRIPKKLRILIVKELELLGLIEEKDKRVLQLKPSCFNEENCNKYYEKLGVY